MGNLTAGAWIIAGLAIAGMWQICGWVAAMAHWTVRRISARRRRDRPWVIRFSNGCVMRCGTTSTSDKLAIAHALLHCRLPGGRARA